MDDIKLYNQTLNKLRGHILFLDHFIKKIKTRTQSQQGKFLSQLEKLYQHANSKELKLDFMIKVEKTITKLREKYESKIVDPSTTKINIKTVELMNSAAIRKDDLNDKVSVSVSESISVYSDSPPPSPHSDVPTSIKIPKFDKNGGHDGDRRYRNGSHDKSDRFTCDNVDRHSSRYDQWWLKARGRLKHDRSEKASETDRCCYEDYDKYRTEQLKKEKDRFKQNDDNSGSSKNGKTDRESGSDRSPPSCQNYSKLVVNPISFRKKIAKISTDDRLTEEDAIELKARHSNIFGCDSDNEDTTDLKKLRELRTKLLTQIAEQDKRNEHRPSTAGAELPISELKISSTTPKTGLKIKLDLLQQREASRECMSAFSTENEQRDWATLSFTETFNQKSKSTQGCSSTSMKPKGFTCIDDDIIAKLTQPINEKNDIATSTSKGVTITNSVSDRLSMYVLKQALFNSKMKEKGKNNAVEVAANASKNNSWNNSERLAYKYNQNDHADQQVENHKQSEFTYCNNLLRSNQKRLSSVIDQRRQAFYPATAVPLSHESYKANSLAGHSEEQYPFPSTSQHVIQSHPNLIAIEPANYEQSSKRWPPVSSTVTSSPNYPLYNRNRPIQSRFRSPLNIERETIESRPINGRHSLDSENNSAPMTYGEYKRRQQAAVSFTSEKFDKNKALETFSECKRSQQTVISSEIFDKGNATNASTKDVSTSHLNSSGNFSAKPNLLVTRSKPKFNNNFKIPKKNSNGAAKSNDIHSNQQSNSSSKVKNSDRSECEVSENGEGVINCDMAASEDPLISINNVKKKSVLAVKKSLATEMQNDAVTNVTSLLTDNQSTVTKEAMKSMLKQVLNPNNLLALVTLCGQLSDDQMFSKIKDIIQHSNETNQSPPSCEESTAEPSTLVEVREDVPKSTKRKNEVKRLNEDIRDMLISDGIVNATGQRMCAVYNKANKGSVAALENVNTENQESRSKGDGAVVNETSVELPPKRLRTMRRSSTMIGFNESLRRYTRSERIHEPKTAKITKIIESSDGDQEESLPVAQLRLTRGKRQLNDEAQNVEIGKKKRLTSMKEVIKNNNSDWHSLNKTMKCQLCEKSSGVSLVNHYVNNHPNKEVFPSRVAPDVADFLRNSTEVHNVERKKGKTQPNNQFKQRCYFCNETKSLPKTGWIQHTSVHTGCYEYKCIDCNRKFSSSPKSHVCKGTSKNKIVKESLPELDEEEVFGYLCDICNFVRFDENEMAKHLCCEHEGNVTSKFKKLIFLRFPNGQWNKNRIIESKSVEQMDTSDLDIKPEIDSLENISRKRSKTVSDMGNDDTELQENSPKKVAKEDDGLSDRSKMTDKEQVATESLDPLTRDEGISIVIKTETDDDDLFGGVPSKETPEEKSSLSTGRSVRDNNCAAPVTYQSQDCITIKEEHSGPTELEISTYQHPENEYSEPVNCYATTNAERTNKDVQSDNLTNDYNWPTKVFTHIYNIGYTDSFGSTKSCVTFSCLIDQCRFETVHLASLLSHIENHTEKWYGFCFTCNAQVINDQVPLNMEFKHMTEAHLKKMDDRDCSKNSDEGNHFVKCKVLPGDRLSKLQETEVAARGKQLIIQDVKPSSSSVCANGFIKVTNTMSETTALPGTTANVSSFVISNVVSLEANKQDHIGTDIVVLKQWTRNPTSKLQSYCKRMIREISMFALFKCMDIECSFTTNNAEHMLTHLRNHENHAVSQINRIDAHKLSWLECAYCDEVGDSCMLLVQHIQDEHRSSVFQCPYCFYRSIAAYNVIVHLSQFHRSKPKSVLVCNGKRNGYATETALIEKSRKEFVRPLFCVEDCNTFTFVMDYFVQHMKSSKFHSDKFKCQFCSFKISITEAAKHLLCHRIGVFECIYCQYGTNDINNIQRHMCNSHSSKLLYICVRLTRKSKVLTDEQLSSVESTLIVDIGQSVDAKLFRRCPYTGQQLNFMNPSIDMNSNISAAIESAPIPPIQPITICFVPINDEIPAIASISNETFFNAETLGSSSERERGLMFSEVLSYKDFEKDYLSDDYDNYFALLPELEQPSNSAATQLVVSLPENTSKMLAPPMLCTDLFEDENGRNDLELGDFEGF